MGYSKAQTRTAHRDQVAHGTASQDPFASTTPEACHIRGVELKCMFQIAPPRDSKATAGQAGRQKAQTWTTQWGQVVHDTAGQAPFAFTTSDATTSQTSN